MTLYGKSGRFYDFLWPKILIIKFKTFYDSAETLLYNSCNGSLVLQISRLSKLKLAFEVNGEGNVSSQRRLWERHLIHRAVDHSNIAFIIADESNSIMNAISHSLSV